MSLRVLYAGTPEPSAKVLEYLIENQGEKYEIVGVLTNPASAKKRSSALIPTAVACVAEKNALPVFTPEHLDSHFRAQIEPLKADLFVCFDYGHIFGPKFLSMFSLGGINLHPSLLPKYRGCTPVPYAILNGDKETGITLQKIALEIDEGDIVAQESFLLDGSETTDSLMDGIVIEKGKVMIKETLCKIVSSFDGEKFSMIEGKKQEGEASYTPFISREDGKIDWSTAADAIERKIRAYTSKPSCFTTNGGVELKILKAHVYKGDETSFALEGKKIGEVIAFVKGDGILIKTQSGLLSVTELQWQAKKAVDYKSFMNGARGFVGSVCE